MTTIELKKAMRVYARAHSIKEPAGFVVNKAWGPAAKTFAWRISAHAFGAAYADTHQTQKLRDLLFPPSLGELVVRQAEAKVGVHEIGSSNSGKWVDQFLKAVLLGPGYAWCAAFATWCAIEASELLRGLPAEKRLTPQLMHDLIMGNAAYVPNWLTAAKAKRTRDGWTVVVVAEKDAKPGDFCIFWGGQHIGILRLGGWLFGIRRRTVEGNTSANETGSQANGGEVANKRRSRGDITAYVRLVPPQRESSGGDDEG